MNNNSKIIVTFVITLFLYVFFKFDFFSLLGLALFIYFSIKLFIEIGEKIEIRDIIILTAILQWIIGPILTYKYFPDNNIYYMAVSRHVYMSFVVPATYAFSIGMYIPLGKKYRHDYYLEKIREFMLENKNWDLVLLFIGIVSRILTDYVPVSLKFFLFLFSGLRFVGLYFLFLSNRKHKNLYVIVIIGWLFFSALRHTIFHELLLWLGFFFIIVAFITKPSTRKKLLYFFGLIFFVLIIQTVKYSYRQAVKQKNTNEFSKFSNLVEQKVLNSSYATSQANLQAAVLRINQGWIIARIMYWTPAFEPFAKGETIKRAVIASIVPRFLDPNKERAGGRTYFKQFTGKNISNNTSMGLGLLGEAYANFGKDGGALFMFIIGLFYDFIFVSIYKIALKHPTLIFFLPLIFLQVVKAEIDFSVILNHLVKSSMVVFLFYFIARKYFNFKI